MRRTGARRRAIYRGKLRQGGVRLTRGAAHSLTGSLGLLEPGGIAWDFEVAHSISAQPCTSLVAALEVLYQQPCRAERRSPAARGARHRPLQPPARARAARDVGGAAARRREPPLLLLPILPLRLEADALYHRRPRRRCCLGWRRATSSTRTSCSARLRPSTITPGGSSQSDGRRCYCRSVRRRGVGFLPAPRN